MKPRLLVVFFRDYASFLENFLFSTLFWVLAQDDLVAVIINYAVSALISHFQREWPFVALIFGNSLITARKIGIALLKSRRQTILKARFITRGLSRL